MQKSVFFIEIFNRYLKHLTEIKIRVAKWKKCHKCTGENQTTTLTALPGMKCTAIFFF
jgi:hypothetical protein